MLTGSQHPVEYTWTGDAPHGSRRPLEGVLEPVSGISWASNPTPKEDPHASLGTHPVPNTASHPDCRATRSVFPKERVSSD